MRPPQFSQPPLNTYKVSKGTPHIVPIRLILTFENTVPPESPCRPIDRGALHPFRPSSFPPRPNIRTSKCPEDTAPKIAECARVPVTTGIFQRTHPRGRHDGFTRSHDHLASGINFHSIGKIRNRPIDSLYPTIDRYYIRW